MPSQAHAAAVTTLALDAATGEVIRAFDRVRVKGVLLKGPVTASWLYGPAAARTYGDIDILVPQSGLALARRALAELGFVEATAGMSPSEEGGDYHEVWSRPARMALLELHWSIYGASAEPAAVWEVFSRGTLPMRVGGAPVATPGIAERLLLVASHAAKHGRAQQQTLEDLERALRLADEASWRRAHALAKEIRAVPALTAGLLLVPAGEGMAARLGLDPRELGLEDKVRAASPPLGAASLARLLETPGIGRKAAFAARKLAPSPALMRSRYGIARKGVLGLAASYLVRLGLLLPNVFSAWRSVMRARGPDVGFRTSAPSGRR